MTAVQPQQQQPYPYPYPALVQQPVVMAVPQPIRPAVQYMPSQQPGVQFVPVPQGGTPLAPQTITPPTSNHLPSHNLILTTIVTIACAILNLTSLIIGAPALICAVMAYLALVKQRYSTTKNLGYTAVALSMANIVYTGIISILIVGLTIGLYSGSERSGHRYSGSNYNTYNYYGYSYYYYDYYYYNYDYYYYYYY